MGTNLRTSQDIQDYRYIFVPISFLKNIKKDPPPHIFGSQKKVGLKWPQMLLNVQTYKKNIIKKTNHPPIF